MPLLIFFSLTVMLSMVRDLDRQDEVESAPAAGQATRQPPLFRLLLFYLFEGGLRVCMHGTEN